MTDETGEKLLDKLVDYIEDAHALEESVVDSLGSMSDSLEGAALRATFERYRETSQAHVERLERRLESLGRDSSVRKRIEGMAVTLLKSVSDAVRTDAPGKVGRDGYLLAHAQIAAYELLQRLASYAGDTETADIARVGREEARAFGDEIAEHWDDFLRLTVADWAEDGRTAPRGGSAPERSSVPPTV